MPIAETAKLTASLDLDDSRYQAGFRKADATLTGFERKTSGTFSKIKQGFGAGIGFAAFNASVNLAARGVSELAGFIEDGVKSVNQLQQAQAATAAAIKSTGGAAGVSAQHIRDLSNAQEDLTSVDDKVIQSGANLLLRFTNIRNAVGQGNDVFDQAVKAATNMAIGLNKGDAATADLQGTALKLGKALNDPVKGLSALGRAGVQFSAAEQKQIKDAVAHNRLLDAQRLILEKVTRLYGGAGAAAANTFAGQQARLRDSIEELQIALVTGLLPGLTAASKALADVFRSPEFIQGAKDLGTAIGNALSPENIKAFIGLARSAAGTVGALVGAIGKAWGAIPPELRDLLVKGFVADRTFKFLFGFSPAKLVVSVATDAIAKGLGGLLGGLFQRGGSPATPMYVKQVGLPTSPTGTAVGGGLGKLGTALAALSIVGDFAAVFATWSAENSKHTQEGLDLQAQQNKWLAGSPKREDIVNGLAAVQKGIADIRSNPLLTLVQGDALKSLESMEAQLKQRLEPTSTAGFTGFEGRGPGFRPADAVRGTADQFGKVVAKLDQLHQDFLTQFGLLKTSKDPAVIAAAATAAAADVAKGVGSLGTTKEIIATLKAQLAVAKDPALRRALTDALHKVEAKLPGREWIAAQERAADKIVASNRPIGQKISELTRIQAALAARGDTKAAAIIAAKIESLKSHLDSIAASVRTLTGVLGRSRVGGGDQNRGTPAPIEAPDPNRNTRKGFDDLKTVITEGNRNVAARTDITELRTDLGQKVRDARNGIVTTTSTGLRGVQTGVRDLGQTVKTAQREQALAVSQAIGRLAGPLELIPGIGPLIKSAVLSLIPHIDSIAARIAISVNRLNTGGTARPAPRGPQNRPDTPVAPSDPRRNPRTTFVPTTIKVTTSVRDNSNATTIHNRYGPTRSQAGAS